MGLALHLLHHPGEPDGVDGSDSLYNLTTMSDGPPFDQPEFETPPAPQESSRGSSPSDEQHARPAPRWRLPLLLVVLLALAIAAGVSWCRRQLEKTPQRCFARALAAIDADDWPGV